MVMPLSVDKESSTSVYRWNFSRVTLPTELSTLSSTITLDSPQIHRMRDLVSDSNVAPYCTDIMKTNEAFIIHVNADFPEHVDFAFKLAIDYRMAFKRDVVVDVSGYRKYGHNEQDQPRFTQPKMYEIVEKKKPMWKMYCEQLVADGVFTQEEIDAHYKKKIERLEEAFEKAKKENFNPKEWDSYSANEPLRSSVTGNKKKVITSISEADFKSLGRKINVLPQGKNFHPTAKKVYEQRLKSIESGEGIDWGTAEALAFGSLLAEGYGVRLSGEDVRRGTFSHRHCVLIDQLDNSRFYPLRQILDKDQEVRFQAFNSLLSEYGVLGFDYGYSLGSPNFLTIWEAQFGDFANVAQPMIDQYIAGGERKWGVKSGLALFLPHGFDGQGPEHSSARIERFLQLMDDDPYDATFMAADSDQQAKLANMNICNITEPANFFHVLRRQMLADYRKPLIILTPKKLLRLKAAQNSIKEFTEVHKFREVIPEHAPHLLDAPEKIKQLIFCSGQVYYDLAERRDQLKRKVDSDYSRTLPS